MACYVQSHRRLRQAAVWFVRCLANPTPYLVETRSAPQVPFPLVLSKSLLHRSPPRCLSGVRRLSTEARSRDSRHVCVLYKGRWMVPFYVLVRLKVLQLTGFAALAIPLNAWFSQGSVDFKVMVSSVFVMIGSAVASTSLWYYSKRYVGELALLGRRQETVRFSVMDFWGNRTEEIYSLDSVIPPLRGLAPEEQSQWIQQRFFVPIDVIGGRQYFVSVKHGHLIDKELLLRLLDGRHLRDHS